MTVRRLIEVTPEEGPEHSLVIELTDEFEAYPSKHPAMLTVPGPPGEAERHRVWLPAGEAAMLKGIADGSAYLVIVLAVETSEAGLVRIQARKDPGASSIVHMSFRQTWRDEGGIADEVELHMTPSTLRRATNQVVEDSRRLAEREAARERQGQGGSPRVVYQEPQRIPDSYYRPDPSPGGIPSFIQNRPGQQAARPPQNMPDWHTLAESGD